MMTGTLILMCQDGERYLGSLVYLLAAQRAQVYKGGAAAIARYSHLLRLLPIRTLYALIAISRAINLSLQSRSTDNSNPQIILYSSYLA